MLFLQIMKNYVRYIGLICTYDKLTIADKIDSMNCMKLQLHTRAVRKVRGQA
jgi:hypothetical protein